MIKALTEIVSDLLLLSGLVLCLTGYHQTGSAREMDVCADLHLSHGELFIREHLRSSLVMDHRLLHVSGLYLRDELNVLTHIKPSTI